ncbi:hypothetical protein [Microbacterium sp. GXF7504]
MIRPATDAGTPQAREIPTALRAAGIGVVDALATTTRSGLNTHLLVSLRLERSAWGAAELRRAIGTIVRTASTPAAYLDLEARGPDDRSIDLAPLLRELGVRPIRAAFTALTMADARRLAEEEAT